MEEVARFPLIDVHSHWNGPMSGELLQAMNAAGIRRMVVFGGEDAARLARQQPDRFVASYTGLLGARRKAMGGGTDLEVTERVGAEFEQALKSGLYKGLGEISTYHPAYSADPIAPDSPLILRFLDLAGRYGVPIIIHCMDSGVSEMARALRAHPKTTVIWAHTGGLSPLVIRDFLSDHPNLYFDLSATHPPWPRRRYPILSFGATIDENWQQLFEEYPDRFLIGFDFSALRGRGTPISAAREAGEFFRSALSQITPTTARKVAYENAQRLYKL